MRTNSLRRLALSLLICIVHGATPPSCTQIVTPNIYKINTIFEYYLINYFYYSLYPELFKNIEFNYIDFIQIG